MGSNCGKRCRVKEIDGKSMVSVVDMVHLHGDYGDESTWQKIKEKKSHGPRGHVAQHRKVCLEISSVAGAAQKTSNFFNPFSQTAISRIRHTYRYDTRWQELGDYVSLLDFYMHVLPQIESKIFESIRASQTLSGIANGLVDTSYRQFYILNNESI